jgi:protein disulfide-isomerase A6
MKPAWDSLGDEFAGSSSVLIADVDCTAGGKSLCEKNGVQGYPTVKYFVEGDIDEGKSYDQGRDFDTLKGFVEETLLVKCLIADPAGSGCDEKEQGYIEKMVAKSADERSKQLLRLDGMKSQTMAPSNKKWLMQRLGVLKQFGAEAGEL